MKRVHLLLITLLILVAFGCDEDDDSKSKKNSYGQLQAIGLDPNEGDPAPGVPEPGAVVLFGAGALVVGAALRRRR